MIVDDGKKLALDNLLSNLTGSTFEMIAVPFDENDPTLTYGDLSFASWTGAAPVALGVMPAATMDGTRASSTRSSAMVFDNSSGVSQTAYGVGWSFMGTLIATKAFDVPEVIPDGSTLEVTPTIKADNLTL